jgi:hypothetical protein
MSIRNSELIDSKTHTFKVLDFITIQLFGGFLWQGDDIHQPHANGSSFWAFEDPPEKAVAGITIADISQDSEEVDIDSLDDEDLCKFDNLLKSSNSEEKNIIEWKGSKLIVDNQKQRLETQYICKEDNKKCQIIEIRFNKSGKKIFISGKYNLDLKEPLAKLISNSLESIKFG